MDFIKLLKTNTLHVKFEPLEYYYGKVDLIEKLVEELFWEDCYYHISSYDGGSYIVDIEHRVIYFVADYQTDLLKDLLDKREVYFPALDFDQVKEVVDIQEIYL